jgi:hypothetical protein
VVGHVVAFLTRRSFSEGRSEDGAARRARRQDRIIYTTLMALLLIGMVMAFPFIAR